MSFEEKNRGRETVLEVKNLSVKFKQYDGAFARKGLSPVKNINISVDNGEIVAIVGASGSGKSLLAHAILGILPYNAEASGEIVFDGDALTEARIKELRGKEIVLVPQSVNYLDPLMKTGKQLALGKGGSGERSKIKDIFGRYNLLEKTADLYPFELSGGMARRVLISSAVLANPKLVIADEPTPGLNLSVARQVLSHFREMADNGAGVLLITHDLELAIETADRIVVFYDGETIDEVSPEDFEKLCDSSVCDEKNNQAMHPYTRKLWESLPKNWK